MRIEALLDLKTRPGENLAWDVEQLRLWWVDSLDGCLFACHTQGGEDGKRAAGDVVAAHDHR